MQNAETKRLLKPVQGSLWKIGTPPTHTHPHREQQNARLGKLLAKKNGSWKGGFHAIGQVGSGDYMERLREGLEALLPQQPSFFLVLGLSHWTHF